MFKYHQIKLNIKNTDKNSLQQVYRWSRSPLDGPVTFRCHQDCNYNTTQDYIYSTALGSVCTKHSSTLTAVISFWSKTKFLHSVDTDEISCESKRRLNTNTEFNLNNAQTFHLTRRDQIFHR